MTKTNTRAFILLFLLFGLLIYFGKWNGQVNQDATTEEGNTNSIFLLIYVPFLIGIIYIYKLWNYWSVLRPIKKEILFFLFSSLILSFFRDDLIMSLRNTGSILLTYIIILGIAVVSFSIPFKRLINLYIIFIVFIFLPSTIYVHITKVGPLNLFPDRTENNNLRLGGLFYYAHTAMILGMGGLFSLYMMLSQIKNNAKLYYLIVYIILNIFLLFTDCRSSWGGVAIAYAVLYAFFVHPRKRWTFIIFCLVLGFAAFSLSSSKEASQKYQTGDDFMFRTMIWNFALEGITEQPITGYSTKVYFTSNKKAMDLNDKISDPHSATLSLALQSGLLILFLFFKLYFRMGKLYWRHTANSNKSLIAVGIFWIFVPFFWGGIYNGTAGFIQIFFPITCFVCFMHPDLHNNPKLLKKLYDKFIKSPEFTTTSCVSNAL